MTVSAVRDDPVGWARRLGVSREAVDVYLAGDVIDLHIESFIWTRLFGYDLGAWHDRTLLGNRFFGQADLPRLRAAGLTGAVMSIATNPCRSARGRREALLRNLVRLGQLLAAAGVDVVADASGYRRARAGGRFAGFIAVQGGNALAAEDLGSPELDVVSRITLVHLTRSQLGAPSAPLGGRGGLTEAGRRFVEATQDRRIIVDLAHASPRLFWDALDAHAPNRPAIVSHTGVWAQRPSWRNVDDNQLRAIADRGGVVGTMFNRGFVARPSWRATGEDIVRHIEHVVRVAGEETAAIGSDFDGMILPPRDVATVLDLPRLVQIMLDRRFPPDRIGKMLGANYLKVMEALRP